MKLTDAIKFFGLPPQNREFDAYLTSLEIYERPTFNQTPTERVNKFKEGYSLIFEEKLGYKEFWGDVRQDGEMIFSSIQVYSEHNDSNFGRYAQPLLHELTFSSTLKRAISILGEPVTDYDSGPENHVSVWYNYQGYTISICFLPNDSGVAFFDIEKAQLSAPQKLDW